MEIIETGLSGVVLIKPGVFGDVRGFFMETWHHMRYQEVGLPADFVQDNLSFSTQGILRGLHYQYPHAQGKLVSVLQGEVFDVAVDIRRGSPTFGRWFGTLLSSDNKRQLYVPEGFAHGFCVTSATALFAYKCTDYYHPEHEKGVLWNDVALGIAWPVAAPSLSDKDRCCPRLQNIPDSALPVYISQ